MNILVIGCSRIGGILAQELADAGHNVSVIDRDGTKLDTLGTGFNGLKVRGIEFDCDHLCEAGIEQADILLSVTPDDNINITVSLIAQKLYRVPRIIARICNPNKAFLYEKLGIETINLTRLGVDILTGRIEDPV